MERRTRTVTLAFVVAVFAVVAGSPGSAETVVEDARSAVDDFRSVAADRDSDGTSEAEGSTVGPTHTVRWACSVSESRSVLIARADDRVGSCALLNGPVGLNSLVAAGLAAEQAEVVRWAVRLFQDAAMDLPTFQLSREPEDGCGGRAATAQSVAAVPRIRVCTAHEGASFEWVMLHELGHLWVERHVGPEQRELFLAVRSLAAWRSDVWVESGTEHAAEVIVWALMDRPVRPSHLPNMSCVELQVAFRALTGVPPLHGFTQACHRF